MGKVNRRQFLRGAVFGSLALLTPYRLWFYGGESEGTVPAQIFVTSLPPTDVFGLAVASGDPTPSGVILWTRVNETVWQPDTEMVFELSLTPNFSQLVLQGVISSDEFAADRDYTVKVDTDGLLSAGTVYFYRFIYQGVASRIGRCRTLPNPTSSLAQMRLAVTTCQHYGSGYYGGFYHLSQEPVDFVVHLGDFIYEFATLAGDYPDRAIDLPSGGLQAQDLVDFRYLYRTYRADPFLQEAMVRHTFVIIWDDHELADNVYWDYANDAPNAPDHPYTDNPEAFTQLQLDSQRAWAEYVPARPALNPQADHPHDHLSIWRSFRFGNLLELFMTDERTYRSSHPCGEETLGQISFAQGCPAQSDVNRTMLGTEQRNWLINGLTSSTATWKVWANQCLFAQLKVPCDPVLDCCPDENPYVPVFLKLDGWDGYLFERLLITTALLQAAVQNTIILTGDLHAPMASYVKVNYDVEDNTVPNNIVGVEFMAPAMTSKGPNLLYQGLELPYLLNTQLVNSYNPHILFFNGTVNGYLTLSLTPQYCDYLFYRVDRTQNSSTTPKQLFKRFRVPHDQFHIYDLGLPDNP